jgi:hypothetical protein
VRENYHRICIILKASDEKSLVPVNPLKETVVEVAHIEKKKTAFHPGTYLHKFPIPGSFRVKPDCSRTYTHCTYHHVKLHGRFIIPVPSGFAKTFEHIMEL